MQKSSSDKSVTFTDVGVYFPPSGKFRIRKKNTDGFWALKNVSFEINKGDTLGIIGRNGAGKSTTLSLINGIIKPDKGTVNTHALSSSLLSLNAGMIPYLSGEKNIFLLGLTLGLPLQTIKEKANEIIDYAELREFIQKPVDTYSSGMKTRLGFATAIHLHPDILLIDEVLGVGDRSFKKKSEETIRTKLKDHITAVIVSHNEKMIRDLCNKAVWIEKGESIAFGTADEIMDMYIKRFS